MLHALWRAKIQDVETFSSAYKSLAENTVYINLFIIQ
jgi:hypothetical protein